MSDYRRLQNIRLPEDMRDKPERTSVSRTVWGIRQSGDSRYSEIGNATVYEQQVIVATAGGKFWVILEVKGEQV